MRLPRCLTRQPSRISRRWRSDWVRRVRGLDHPQSYRPAAVGGPACSSTAGAPPDHGVACCAVVIRPVASGTEDRVRDRAADAETRREARDSRDADPDGLGDGLHRPSARFSKSRTASHHPAPSGAVCSRDVRRAVVGELVHCTVARGLERFADRGPGIVLLVLALYATAVVVALATAALTGASLMPNGTGDGGTPSAPHGPSTARGTLPESPPRSPGPAASTQHRLT